MLKTGYTILLGIFVIFLTMLFCCFLVADYVICHNGNKELKARIDETRTNCIAKNKDCELLKAECETDFVFYWVGLNAYIFQDCKMVKVRDTNELIEYNSKGWR